MAITPTRPGTTVSNARATDPDRTLFKEVTDNIQVNFHKLRHQVWYFTTDAVNNEDTWASGIKGLVECAWQDETPATTTGVTVTNTLAGVVTFYCDTTATDHEGWLHTWSTGQ
jgi:hypothetical protein